MTLRRMAAVVTIGLGVATGVVFADNLRGLRAALSGYQEVPAVSTTGSASFSAQISQDETQVDWQLSYQDTETAVTQAHIHFAAPALNGSIIVFLCSNLGNGPVGTQPCPAAPATVEGTFEAKMYLGTPPLKASRPEPRRVHRRHSRRRDLRKRAHHGERGWRDTRANQRSRSPARAGLNQSERRSPRRAASAWPVESNQS